MVKWKGSYLAILGSSPTYGSSKYLTEGSQSLELEPLGYQPGFWKMYHSVMIGYLINLTIPRSGEVARAGYYAKFEKEAEFNKVFGTIIVERVVDMLMLGIVVLITIYLQVHLIDTLFILSR